MVIYFMTAFFLSSNNASWVWWAVFLLVCLWDQYLWVTEDYVYDDADQTKVL